MSVFKQKNAIASFEFKKFKGIDRRAPHGDSNAAYDMSNFRVLADGSLQKRDGYKLLSNVLMVRGVWSGKLNDETQTFILHGNTVIKLIQRGESVVNVGKIRTSSGPANFIAYNNHLYLYDKEIFYIVTEDAVVPAECYAPLYAKDWPVARRGEVNEPINLATRHIRMTYVVNEVYTYLCVDHVISSIDAVYIDGVLITDKSRYQFKENLMCVSVLGLNQGEHVTLYLTIAESELNSALLMSCKHAAVYGDFKGDSIFFWEGNKKNIMFSSRSVDSASVEESSLVYENTIPLYIPIDGTFKLPKEDTYITAVCRQYDRLLIFTKTDTWMAHLTDSPNRTLDAVTVNPSYGCSASGAVVMCGNDPVCVSDGTILRWTADTDELNECNAYSISSKIESMLAPSFFSNAIVLHDKNRSEILFSDSSDSAGPLWIYNYDTDNWFKFDGIGAKSLFLHDEALCFVRLNKLYIFDKSLAKDMPNTDTYKSIESFYESYPSDFSVSGNKKRLSGMTMGATLSGGNISAEYLSDGETISSVTLRSDTSFPASFIKRLNSRRFCYANLRLSSNSDKPQRIYSTSICAKN